MELMHRDPAKNFYPRPPRGGRPGKKIPLHYFRVFLSTPSARRATSAIPSLRISISIFLSTPSARRATQRIRNPVKHPLQFLSTPSARRATCPGCRWAYTPRYFYPRPPRGGRQLSLSLSNRLSNFYPRPPRGGRPYYTWFYPVLQYISIHALREEGDGAALMLRLTALEFLSTPSARRAT